MNGKPWSFDNAMLVIDQILTGVEPLKVPLWFMNFRIEIYDLHNGFMSEAVGQQLRNFFGKFISYDAKIWREFMPLKIRVDVRKPLKRKKKIKRKNGSKFKVLCKYDRLGKFCFLCGLATHTERFCRRSLDNRGEGVVKEWGAWLSSIS